MKSLQIESIATATDNRCEQVNAWLREYNVDSNPQLMERLASGVEPVPLLVFAMIEGSLVGGVIAHTDHHWLKISIAAVDPSLRQQGIGTTLLKETERVAIERGCKWAFVDTMEYQAPQFYVRNGYQAAAEIDDWDSLGHKKYFFTRRLT